MNFLNKILLAVFLSLFCFCSITVAKQAYSADHLILQDLDTQNNLATICQNDGSLCSDVEVVSFNDLDSDQKDQVIEVIASSAMDRSSYSSILDLDKFRNFLSHSDKISYSTYLPNSDSIITTGNALISGAIIVFITSGALDILGIQKVFPKTPIIRNMVFGSIMAGAAGILIYFFGVALSYLKTR